MFLCTHDYEMLSNTYKIHETFNYVVNITKTHLQVVAGLRGGSAKAQAVGDRLLRPLSPRFGVPAHPILRGLLRFY